MSRTREDYASYIADAYAYRGEGDRAFSSLERAYRQKGTVLYAIKSDLFLKHLKVVSPQTGSRGLVPRSAEHAARRSVPDSAWQHPEESGRICRCSHCQLLKLQACLGKLARK